MKLEAPLKGGNKSVPAKDSIAIPVAFLHTPV
jgi:hypothetical protein